MSFADIMKTLDIAIAEQEKKNEKFIEDTELIIDLLSKKVKYKKVQEILRERGTVLSERGIRKRRDTYKKFR